jgi:hypothetical protein
MIHPAAAGHKVLRAGVRQGRSAERHVGRREGRIKEARKTRKQGRAPGPAIAISGGNVRRRDGFIRKAGN